MMKKYIGWLLMVVAVVMSASLSSCGSSDADKKVEAFTNLLSSEDFKTSVMETGLYTDCEVSTAADGKVLQVTLHGVPGLRFDNSFKFLVDEQHQNMVTLFQTAVSTDKIVKEGFEGMKDKDMTFRVRLLDVDGGTIDADITPEEVLPAK